MTAVVRLVYYVIDPYTGESEVFAAQVRDADGARVLRVAPRAVPPGARGAVERALIDLEAEPAFDALPIGAGPQVVASEPRLVPASVQDADTWVRDVLLRPAA